MIRRKVPIAHVKGETGSAQSGLLFLVVLDKAAIQVRNLSMVKESRGVQLMKWKTPHADFARNGEEK